MLLSFRLRYSVYLNLQAPEQSSTDNNGLGMTVDVLEEIYTNRDFPKGTPKMETSLAKGGKSRADLWAFAALVAAEWGIERNNHACAGIVEPGDKDICQHIQVSICWTSGKIACFPDHQIISMSASRRALTVAS